MSRDFGLNRKREPEPAPEQRAAFAAAGEVRPVGLSGELSMEERTNAARAAAAESGFTSREPRPIDLVPTGAARPGELVSFEKPAKAKVRGAEPLYSLNMRPRVSVVNRFNKLADELRMSNPELLEYLLAAYENARNGGQERR